MASRIRILGTTAQERATNEKVSRALLRPVWGYAAPVRRLGLILLLLLIPWLASGVIARQMVQRARPKQAEAEPPGGQNLRLISQDGLDLGAWWLDRGDPVVVLVHGNGSKRSDLGHLLAFFTHEGCSVLALTVRAHGDSDGDQNDLGWSAQHDVQAALDWLNTHQKGRPVLLMGVSLGAAAVSFANRQHALPLILESPYADLATAVENRSAMLLPSPLDTLSSKLLLSWSPLLLPVPLQQLSPVNAVRALPPTTPVLVLAGDADLRATVEEAEQFVAAHAQTELVRISNADHGQLWSKGNEAYKDALRKMIERTRNPDAPQLSP